MLSVTSTPFGTSREGHEATLFTLKNNSGMQVQVCDFGALLTSVCLPNKEGHLVEITLGYDDLAGWEDNGPYFGATVGRYANRIAAAQFTLDGKTYSLAGNNDPDGKICALHGGEKGFNKVQWQGEAVQREDACGVKLTYRSVDGEEGFPGNLDLTVTYWLTDANELHWEVDAVSDAPTPINIVQHTYWNLSGDPARDILDHELEIPATHYLPTCSGMIPLGEAAPVKDTPLCFSGKTRIGERIDADFEALNLGRGYDHCYVLENPGTLRRAGILSHPESGRSLEILTDQPGVQIYSGNYLEGSKGRGGVTHPNRAGACLETQNYPDAPNQAQFPNSILRPGESYRHEMVMRFTF